MSSSRHEQSALPPALVRAFHEDEPTEGELERAYLRFAQRRTRPRVAPRLPVLGWVAAGMLLGIGSLYAASGAPWPFLSPPKHKPEAPAARDSATRVPLRRPGRLPPATLPSGAPTAAPSGARLPSPNTETNPLGSTGALPARESWQRAARSLREHDFGAADETLQQLALQGDSSERETAQLVRAQVLLSQGRNREASDLLAQLSRGATSPAVRAKAAALLLGSSGTRASHRSFELDAGTK